MSDCLLKVAYAILDKKGRVVFATDDADNSKDYALIYATKTRAQNNCIPEENETVGKISICKENKK